MWAAATRAPLSSDVRLTKPCETSWVSDLGDLTISGGETVRANFAPVGHASDSIARTSRARTMPAALGLVARLAHWNVAWSPAML